MNGRDKVKVLIIEDNKYKLEDAIQVLQKNGITDYVHVNNYLDAVNVCFRKQRLSEFDFIILDIQFFEYRPLDRTLPDQYAGYRFLYKLAAAQSSTPVLVFSSVEDYLKEYKDFLFPSYAEYSKSYMRNSFIFSVASTIHTKYEEDKKRNQQILEYTNFVIGHAHNKHELHNLLKNYLGSNNQNTNKEQV